MLCFVQKDRAVGSKKQNAEKIVLSSLAGKAGPRVPFWLMRQAGRYLPEYRAVRKKAGSFLDLCFNPEFAADVTLQPVRRFGTDAAILFSDILVVPYAMGQTLDFVEGEGPRLGALENRAALDRLSFDEKKLAPVYETVKKVRHAFDTESTLLDKTLIGFAGAPWTVACYMIEGKGDREFIDVRKYALAQEEAFGGLISRLTAATIAYLSGQIRAGAEAVQVFDSWAGLLPEPMFRKWVVAPTREIVAALKKDFPDTPVIGFPRGAGGLYGLYVRETGVTGVSLDTSVPLSWAVKDFGKGKCLQGNLDPVTLLAGGPALDAEIKRILTDAGAQPFIFNLGHGIIKETPVEHVARLAELVRGFSR